MAETVVNDMRVKIELAPSLPSGRGNSATQPRSNYRAESDRVRGSEDSSTPTRVHKTPPFSVRTIHTFLFHLPTFPPRRASIGPAHPRTVLNPLVLQNSTPIAPSAATRTPDVVPW